MLIQNGKDISDSLFCVVCYAVRYEQTKKTEKWSDEELNNNLPNDIFLSLGSIRPPLNYIRTLKNCFLTNKILMQEMSFFRIHKLRKKFRYVIYTNYQKTKITRDLSNCITEKLNGFHIAGMETKNELRVLYSSIDLNV